MNLVLTMAGNYSRFIESGYKIPKFLLPWGNRSVISEIINEMNNNFDQIYLVAHSKDENFLSHVLKIIEHYGINKNNLIVIDKTNSQSETVFKFLNLIEFDKPFVIHNIDTILYDRDYGDIEKNLTLYDGFIDVFDSNNPNYSYVLVKNKLVEEIVEKHVISNLATSGMYGFKNPKIFIENYSDGYISDIYKKMVCNGYKITTGNVHNENNTIVLGTPKEYLNLSNNFL